MTVSLGVAGLLHGLQWYRDCGRRLEAVELAPTSLAAAARRLISSPP